MPSSEIFPYGIVFKGSGEIDVFPAAKVFFPYKDGGEVPLFLLIDSGAHISALPKQDAEAFGIAKAENENPTLISGIGGMAVRGWRHEIKVRLGSQIFMLPIVFLDDADAPRVLGRFGVFEKFTVVFEERNKRSGFLNVGGIASKSLSKILDKASR